MGPGRSTVRSILDRDIRSTPLYREALELHTQARRPGSGEISDASDLQAAPDGQSVLFAGSIVAALAGSPETRICQLEVLTGQLRILTAGPGTERCPRCSPDGRWIAFLSDRHAPGDFQLHLLNVSTRRVERAGSVDGWVEYLQWSPDGRHILLGVAAHGAEVSSGQGAIRSASRTPDSPSWMPSVETARDGHLWRRLWVFNLAEGRAEPLSPPALNVWDARWVGSEALALVTSSDPGEGAWFSARLSMFRLGARSCAEIHAPSAQLGALAGAASGRYLAFVESTASDRGIVAGDVIVVDLHSGHRRLVQTAAVDVAHLEWQTDRSLLVAGHRVFETVVGIYDPQSGLYREIWCSAEVAGSGTYVSVSSIGQGGDCALIAEGYQRSPEIGVIQDGRYRTIRSFDLGDRELTQVSGSVAQVRWEAADGWEMSGWLLRPHAPPPHPLILHIHGGPVWHWRPQWFCRSRAHVPMLGKRGYAHFFPNPRGSVGFGREFIAGVVGDMGGADAADLLSGLDYLVQTGVAHGGRLGVTGVSYGGFMSSWLVTRTDRFRAAVPVSPVNNFVTEHLTSNSPHWVPMFLQDTYTNASGRYFERSPIMHAHKTRTPTLNVCGSLDRAAPPEEALQFHNAQLQNATRSVLLTYPEEGHGIRHYPAMIDFAARVVSWFEEHV